MKTHRSSRQDVCCRTLIFASLIYVALVDTSEAQIRTDSLPEVKVISTKYNVPAISQPQQVVVIDKETLQNTTARDVVSLLAMYGHAYLRSNGPGLASGLTQRGFGTTSFQVVRDGFTLNQPMHGQVDLALISVSTLGTAEIATANSSSTFGSAAPGGSLLIGSNWNQGWNISHEQGPWGYQETTGAVVTRKGNSNFLLNGGATSSDNTFTYNSPDDNVDLRRNNSRQDRKWVHLGTLTNQTRYTIRTSMYAHLASREIPDPINFLGMKGLQDDEEIRFTAEMTGIGTRPNWTVGTQVWQSKLLYSDIWLADRSYNRVRGGSFAGQYTLAPAPWYEITASAGGEVVGVATNNYELPTTRNSMNASLFGLIRAPYGLLVFPAARIDAIEDIGTAVSPSIGLNKAIVQDVLHLRSQWSYNFTAPTLNDQFWNFSGNRDLKSERAHKGDVGLHFQKSIGKTDIDWQTQGYFTRANNGIVWQPGADGFWSPVNVQEMNGHGMEQSIKIASLIKGVEIYTGSQITWNRAYIPAARYEGDRAVDKQLRYTPEWMFRLQVGANFRNVQLKSEITHDGKRFSSEDHSSSSDPLPAHTVANFSGQIRIPIGKLEPSLRLSVINAFDTKYSMLAWYPMPGRHLLVGVKIKQK